MAGKGFAPTKAAPEVELTPDGKVRGPDLPVLADDVEWPGPTVVWWENWRCSAQAQTFGATDWDFLLETAMLHAKFWSGDDKVAGELRLRVAKFGATVEDRLRLKMAIGEPKKAEVKKGPSAKRSSRLRVVGAEAS